MNDGSKDCGHTGNAISCDNCGVARLCLPSGLSKEELDRLDNVIQRRRTLEPGNHLFRAGDPLVSLMAVRSGSVKIYSVDLEGREQVLGFFFPGEIVGLEGISSGLHTCFAISLETTSVCLLPFTTLSDLASHIPSLQQQLFKIMSKELISEYAIAGDYSAEERLAAFILSLSIRFKRRGYSATSFTLSMSRQDIANYLRLAPETVSRILNHFQKEALMSISRRNVDIHNMEGLIKIAQCALHLNAHAK